MPAQLDVVKSINNIWVNIYSFNGELDELNVDTTFNQIIEDLGDFTGARIIFHFGNLRYINSKTIGWLADVAGRAKDGGGKLIICDPTIEVRDTLELNGVWHVMPIAPNERAAHEEFLN
jgi:anti-anti-sigma factor